MADPHFTIRDLFEKWRELAEVKHPDAVTAMKVHVYNVLQDSAQDVEDSAGLQAKLQGLIYKFDQKWKKDFRVKSKFETTNKAWLDSAFELPPGVCSCDNCSPVNKARAKRSFSESSDKTKKRRTEDLVGRAPDELAFAAKRAYWEKGQRSAAKLVSM